MGNSNILVESAVRVTGPVWHHEIERSCREVGFHEQVEFHIVFHMYKIKY